MKTSTFWHRLGPGILLAATSSFGAVSSSSADVLVRAGEAVPHRGVCEIVLEAPLTGRNPYFDVDLRVLFVRPDETRVTVDGFYDGNETFSARAYGDTLGRWRWRSVSNVTELDGKAGQFQVVPSRLPGKLRKHPDGVVHLFHPQSGERLN